MDKYRKIPKPREASPPDEIRVTGNGHVTNYVTYTARLFNDSHNSVTIRATGNAVSIAVTVAEVVKRRFKGIHQLTTIGSTQLVSEYEPLEEGLDNRTETRTVSFISIKLARDEDARTLDLGAPGYQEPLDEALVKELAPGQVSRMSRFRRRFPRRGGRGGGYSRGGGGYRGRGRGGQGPQSHLDGSVSPPLMDGYNMPPPQQQQHVHGGYEDEYRPRGGHRGRGRGRGGYGGSPPFRGRGGPMRGGMRRGRGGPRGRGGMPQGPMPGHMMGGHHEPMRPNYPTGI